MPITLNETQQLKSITKFEIIECASCNCQFAITSQLEYQRRGDHQSFYCPNGHANYYRESREDRLRQELEEAQKRIAREVARTDQAMARAVDLKHSLRTVKGNVTKLKKRIGNGVCPCCNRHFVNVERHMKNQHPYFIDADN